MKILMLADCLLHSSVSQFLWHSSVLPEYSTKIFSDLRSRFLQVSVAHSLVAMHTECFFKIVFECWVHFDFEQWNLTNSVEQKDVQWLEFICFKSLYYNFDGDLQKQFVFAWSAVSFWECFLWIKSRKSSAADLC